MQKAIQAMLSSPAGCQAVQSNQVMSRGKLVPKLAQRVGQVRGCTLWDNGQLLQSLRSDVHPLPDPVLGIAKAGGSGPFSSRALGDNRQFVWTLGNDVHPEPDPVIGIARVEAAGPFFGHVCDGSEGQRQPVKHHGQEDHQDESHSGLLQG